MKCSSGHDNAPGSAFCSQCGERLNDPGDKGPPGSSAAEPKTTGTKGETRDEYLARINATRSATKPAAKKAGASSQNKLSGGQIGCLVVIVLIIIGAIASVLGISGNSGSGGGSDSVRGDGGQEVSLDRAGAADVCEKFVRDRLKAPDTATFRDPYGDQISYTGGGNGPITVDASVDSENGFGAKLRSTYSCTVSQTGGDNWHLDDIQINDGGN
jgi:hypothetical protein